MDPNLIDPAEYEQHPLMAQDARMKRWQENHWIRLDKELQPLDPDARQAIVDQIKTKCELLARHGICAKLYCTSKSTHAWQTGKLLALQQGGGKVAPVLHIWALTGPHQEADHPFESIIAELGQSPELKKAGIEPQKLDAIVLIGHEPRLTQVLRCVTSQNDLTKIVTNGSRQDFAELA